jgi:hypothetical protein
MQSPSHPVCNHLFWITIVNNIPQNVQLNDKYPNKIRTPLTTYAHIGNNLKTRPGQLLRNKKFANNYWKRNDNTARAIMTSKLSAFLNLLKKDRVKRLHATLKAFTPGHP